MDSIKIAEISEVSRRLLEEIKEDQKLCPKEYNEYCVNWADLRVVDVEYYECLSGEIGYRVYISEANCEKLSRALESKLIQLGFTSVEVRTEW